MNDERIDLLTSAGHAEYVLPLPPEDVTWVWSSEQQEALDEVVEYEGDVWERLTGIPNTLRPDADLGWEHIIHIHAPRAHVEAALATLLADIAFSPHGDDDVFDYWPSGVRLARSVADALGGDWPQRVEDAARAVVAGMSDETAEDVGQRLGVAPSPEQQ